MPERTIRLLVVEDNDLDVMLVHRLVQRLELDIPIVRAANGEEALAILCPDSIDLILPPPFIILLDINMPRMDGFELLDALEGDAVLVNVPIYLVSTSDSSYDMQRAEQYQVSGYVVKPLTAPLLMNMLESIDTSQTTDPPTQFNQR